MVWQQLWTEKLSPVSGFKPRRAWVNPFACLMVDCRISAYYSNSNPDYYWHWCQRGQANNCMKDGLQATIKRTWVHIPQFFFLKNQVGWDFVGWVVAIGALFGLSTSLLGSMFPLPRILVSVLAWSQKSYRPLIQDMIELKRLYF